MDVPVLNMSSMENVAPCVPPVQYKCSFQILYDKCWNTLHNFWTELCSMFLMLDAESQSQFAAFRQAELTDKKKTYEYRLSFLASGYDSI